MSEKNLNKVSQYTRKKIQNYSYGLNDQIGKGYSSQVYRGRNDQTDQPVAVKVIDLKMLKSQINRSLLASEIDILKSMKGVSYILALHDVYTTRNNTYIITELCDSDLNKKIKKKLTEQEIFRYMKQLISGYAHVHKASIIHRDLKPANILITTDNILKIADFGFGIKAEEVLKPSKYNVGSPLYMAPESLRKNEYSFKTDIWALGVICYEMLTLETPWKAKNQKQLLKKIQAEKIQDVILKKEYNFHPIMKDFIIKALTYDKNARLAPQQLFEYNFCDRQKVTNLINENKLHLTLKYETFVSQLSTPHKSRDKLSNNQKSQKKILNSVSNAKNIQSQQHSLSQLPAMLRGETTPGTEHRNQNPSPKHKKVCSFTNTNTKLESQNLNPEKVHNFSTVIKKEQKKNISKILIAQVHFCRFLFKLLMRIKESSDEGILAPYKSSHQIKNIFISYTRIIKNKLKRIMEFSSNNFLKIHKDTHQQYQETSDFKKLIKISKEYTQRYSKQLNQFWKAEQYQYSVWVLLDTSSTNTLMSLIKVLLEQNIDLNIDNNNNRISANYQTNDDAQNGKISFYSKDIIILDYLMTSRQLLDILKENPQDHQKFSRKSRIEEIVQGATAIIDTPLYIKILDRAMILLEGDMLPVTNTNKGIGKIAKEIDNRCR